MRRAECESQQMPSQVTDKRKGRTLGATQKQLKANEPSIEKITNCRDQGSEKVGAQVEETRKKCKHSWDRLKALIDHQLEQT